MIVKPGPFTNFLKSNLNFNDIHKIDWAKVSYSIVLFMNLINVLALKVGIILQYFAPIWLFMVFLQAKRALKNLRIKTTHRNSEFRIIGLSEKTCYEEK
jgi:hypothetical protein